MKTTNEIAKGIIYSGLIKTVGDDFDFLLHQNLRNTRSITEQEREDIAHETRKIGAKISQILNIILD